MKRLRKNFISKLKSKFRRELEPDDIDYQQLKQLQRQGAALIDVRSTQEFAEGHLDGAICIPEYNIQREIKSKVPDVEKTIVLYCDSGGRSRTAKEKLKKLGYKNVYNLYQGLN